MKLGYTILYVPDVAKAVAFYQQAFGLPVRLLHESGLWAELETGTTALAFAHESMIDFDFEPQRPDGRPAAVEVALVTAQVALAYERAVQAGAVSVLAPTAKPWGQIVSYVRDLNGFMVEICSEVSA